MEVILISALAYAGYKIKDDDNNNNELNCNTDSESLIIKDIYNSNELKKIKKKSKQIAKNKKKDKSRITGKITEGFGNVKKEDNYKNQFDTLEFNSSGPNSMNENDSGFSTFDNGNNMTYNITNIENFQHNNMNPHTSARDIDMNLNSQDSVFQERLGIFTGSSDTYQPKKESAPLFKPMKDLTYVNGAPNNIDILQDRYLPSMMKNNENLPFSSNIKVLPGLDGRNQDGLYGDTRILPKSSNELRNRNNPLTSYESRIIGDGKKGEYRAPDPNVQSRKPMTYKINKKDDIYPTVAHYRQQTLTGKINPTYTNRTKSIYHSGPAKSENYLSMPDDQRAKIRETDKVGYRSDGITRNVNSNVKSILQNKKSINLPTTRREATSGKSYVGGIGRKNDSKSYTINRSDVPLTTLKQTMINNRNIMGVTATQNNHKSYTFDKNMILPRTIKETTINKTRHGGAIGHVNKSMVYDPSDRPNVTIKQTTIANSRTGDVKLQGGTYAFDPNDKPGVTVKQTTVGNTRTGDVRIQEGTYAFDPNDKPATTLKQTTVGNTRTGDVRIQEGTYAFDPNDKPATTLKQTIVGNTRTGDVRIQEGTYAFDPNDKPATTLKQTIVGNTRTGDVRIQEGTYAFNPNDTPATTIKQTTVGNTRTGDLRIQEGTYAFNPYDTPATTIKQTTVANTRTGEVRIQEGTYAFNPNDTPATTIKQTTVGNTRTGDLTIQGGTYAFNPKDTPNVTMKETTIGNTRTGEVRIQEGTYAFNPNDKPLTTMKETTVGNTRTGEVRIQEGTYAFNPNDKPGTTLKQTLVDKTRTGGLTGAINKSKAFDPNDKPLTTMKETLVGKTRVGGIEGKNGTYTLDKSDIAKPTMKQTTVGKTYTGVLSNPTDKNTGYLTSNMEAPVTQRQTMHKSHTGAVFDSQGKGYISNKMHAPTTTKETTMLQDYTGGMKHELENHRIYDDVIHMETNQEREKIAQGRKPTQRSYNKGPNKKDINVNLKSYVNSARDNVPSRSLNQNMENNLSSMYSRNRFDLNECNGLRLDPTTLSALKDNPYVNNMVFTQNSKENPYEDNEKC
ncbi:hypothetical protein CPAV1605_654 [seawater metagenome]|uniref:Uncharacterized protein n=1 Tax=seawater metagenome TaxID=1561972 RepID=A0A5E8CJW4_9ZZZZ